jgi:chemotaxis protein CheC
VAARTLTALQLDALREIGGIGAGHATMALAQLVDEQIAIEVPQAEMLDLRDVVRAFGGPEVLAFGSYSRFGGDITGGVLFLAERDSALALNDMLHGRKVGTTLSLSHEGEAILGNACAVLLASYLAAIARMADLDVVAAQPATGFDMAGALLEAVVTEVGGVADQAILVRTAFLHRQVSVDAAFFFLPDPESLSVLLGRLGVQGGGG